MKYLGGNFQKVCTSWTQPWVFSPCLNWILFGALHQVPKYTKYLHNVSYKGTHWVIDLRNVYWLRLWLWTTMLVIILWSCSSHSIWPTLLQPRMSFQELLNILIFRGQPLTKPLWSTYTRCSNDLSWRSHIQPCLSYYSNHQIHNILLFAMSKVKGEPSYDLILLIVLGDLNNSKPTFTQ
jgi:hypothetical protein